MSEKNGIRAALADVGAFHKAIPDDLVQDRGQHPPALVRRSMRHRLLREEFDELTDAMLDNDIVEVADAYADMIYVLLGSAIMHFGAERFARVWDEVQRSNMAKLTDGRMVMREDGKVIKPEGWTAPDVVAALKDQQDGISWREECEIIEGCTSSRPNPNTVMVRHKSTNRFLRYSCGPKQGHFWDVYGDDYQERALAELAISQADRPEVAP